MLFLRYLADAFTTDSHRRCELDFDVDVAARAHADDVAGDAVVGAAVLLRDGGNDKDVALEDSPVVGQGAIVLESILLIFFGQNLQVKRQEGQM
jgi:hypothetical protein